MISYDFACFLPAKNKEYYCNSVHTDALARLTPICVFCAHGCYRRLIELSQTDCNGTATQLKALYAGQMAPRPDGGSESTNGSGLDPGKERGVESWTLIANEHWLKTSKPKKIKPDIIKREVWDVLEGENFPIRSLLVLENLQFLEAYAHEDELPP